MGDRIVGTDTRVLAHRCIVAELASPLSCRRGDEVLGIRVYQAPALVADRC
jgi:hypothetical protein